MCIRSNIDLVYINAQNFIKIHSLVLKILRKNTFFISIKGHNSVVYKQIKSIYIPKPLLPDVNFHAKFEENWSKTTQVSPETKC